MAEAEKDASTPVGRAERLLGVLMAALGAAAIAIGLSIFLFGGSATAHATEALFAQLRGRPPVFTGAFGPTCESEFGFYTPLWIAYGVILIVTARALPRALRRVPILSAIFFAGGVGRALAWLRAGPPHPAFAGLMVVELTLPVVFIGLWATARNRRTGVDVE